MPLRRRRSEVELRRELAGEPQPLLLRPDNDSAPPKREAPTDDLPRRALAQAETAGTTGRIGATPAPEDIVNGVVDAAPEDIVKGVEDEAAAPEDIVNGVVGAAPEAMVDEGDDVTTSGAMFKGVVGAITTSMTMGSALMFMFMSCKRWRIASLKPIANSGGSSEPNCAMFCN